MTGEISTPWLGQPCFPSQGAGFGQAMMVGHSGGAKGNPQPLAGRREEPPKYFTTASVRELT